MRNMRTTRLAFYGGGVPVRYCKRHEQKEKSCGLETDQGNINQAVYQGSRANPQTHAAGGMRPPVAQEPYKPECDKYNQQDCTGQAII